MKLIIIRPDQPQINVLCQHLHLWVLKIWNSLPIALKILLKLINNSSSWNKKIITVTMVWKCDLNFHIFLRFSVFVYSLVLVLIDKIYQAFETVFHRISKFLEFRQKTPLRVLFSTLFSVFGNVMKHCLSCLIYYLIFK